MENNQEILVSEASAFDDDYHALVSAVAEAGGPGFQPDTPEKAAWLTSRILFHEAEAKRIKEAMAREAGRHAKAADYLREAYGPILEGLARNLIEAEGGKRQKAILPNGVGLAFRKIPDGLGLSNPDLALGWARVHNPSAIREEVSKSALSAWFKETGEIPDGCEPLRDRVGFYIQG